MPSLVMRRSLLIHATLAYVAAACGPGAAQIAGNDEVDDEGDVVGAVSAATDASKCSELPETCLGANCEPQSIAVESERFILAMAQSGRYIFFTTCRYGAFPSAPNYSDCELKRLHKKTNAIKILATNLGQASGGIAVDSQNVYLATQCNGELACEISKYSRRNGTLSTLVPYRAGTSSTNMRVDATHLYWSGIDEKYWVVIQRLPLKGGDIQTLLHEPASGEGYPPRWIELNDTHLFYATRRLTRLPKDGSATSETLYNWPGQYSVSGIALDSEHLYSQGNNWGSQENGGVVQTRLDSFESSTLLAAKSDESTRPGNGGLAPDGRGNIVFSLQSEPKNEPAIRSVRMYLGNSKRTVELARGLSSEVSLRSWFETIVTDGKDVYFSAIQPLSREQYRVKCPESGKSCGPNGALYKVALCKP